MVAPGTPGFSALFRSNALRSVDAPGAFPKSAHSHSPAYSSATIELIIAFVMVLKMQVDAQMPPTQQRAS